MRWGFYTSMISIVLCTNAFSADLRGVKHSILQGVILKDATPTVLMAYRAELDIERAMFCPIAQLTVVTAGTTQLSLLPRLSLGATVRLDILEFVPYVTGRLGAGLESGIEVQGTLSVGIERIYQNGWFYNMELGLEQPFTEPDRFGGIFLLGIGFASNLDELV